MDFMDINQSHLSLMKQNEPITVDTQPIKIIRNGKASCCDARNWCEEKIDQTLIN